VHRPRQRVTVPGHQEIHREEGQRAVDPRVRQAGKPHAKPRVEGACARSAQGRLAPSAQLSVAVPHHHAS
jgi:hypothetical protein